MQHGNSVALTPPIPIQMPKFSILVDKISQELISLFPSCSHSQLRTYASKYTKQVIDELKISLVRPRNANNELSFSLNACSARCQITSMPETRLVSELMHLNQRTSLILVRFVGNRGRLSRVVINDLYKEQIMAVIAEQPTTSLSESDRKTIQQESNISIPVDSHSLLAFVEQTQAAANTAGNSSAYSDQLIKNLLSARVLLSQIESVDDQEIIKEVWTTSDAGRRYGRFNSLQRQNVNVRHAALGHCWKYDFKACSLAVIMSMAAKLDPGIKQQAVAEYIRSRSRIRQRIAKETGVSSEQIKTVFTQLGFGAEVVMNPYKAIRKTLKSDAAFEKLVSNQTFDWINQDLAVARQIILDHTPDEFTGKLGYVYHARIQDPGKLKPRKRTSEQKVAWIYQNAESYLLFLFTEYVRATTGQEPIMTVHDCLYYKNPLPADTVQNLRYELKQEYQYFDFEEEEIWPITTQARFDSRFEDQDREIAEHKARMHKFTESLLKDTELMIKYRQSQTTKPAPLAAGDSGQRTHAYMPDVKTHWSEQDSYTSYDLDSDPFYDDLSKKEKQELTDTRSRVLGTHARSDIPQEIQVLLRRTQ